MVAGTLPLPAEPSITPVSTPPKFDPDFDVNNLFGGDSQTETENFDN